jgi:diadenosine tetraphosphate (Ap4A) HIT family hydrolase
MCQQNQYIKKINVSKKSMHQKNQCIKKINASKKSMYQKNQCVKKTPGINVIMNCGEAAGQEVPHPHIHIIPRKEGDGLKV